MERAQRTKAARIVPVGDAALLVRVGSRPGPVTTRKVLALVSALDAMPLPGVRDVVPAYASVLVRFDPLLQGPAAIAAYLSDALARAGNEPLPRGRLVHIPVRYGGDYGPDLDEVARRLGLSASELIHCHASATYRVAFLGFLAGFPYLTGLPRALAVPRLATPRTRVPAGSVAIAERQAGIYPVASPGGWRILGRTPLALFDAEREPPALLQPGDRVRFYPISEGEQAPAPENSQQRTTAAAAIAANDVPWLRVLEPGIQATVQDRGRHGYARYGVSTSGAADPYALALGNALLANRAEAAALEITGGNASFEALAPCVVAVTGAPCIARVNQRRIPADVTFALATGDTLDLGTPAAGMRVYLCVAGGVATPRVMGSRATDLRAHLGGYSGRALRADDMLARGPATGTEASAVAGRTLPRDLGYRLPANGAWQLRILPGPHVAQSPGSLDGLMRARFAVDARSDRVGVRLRRLDGPCLGGGQVLSEGVPRGAVQLPPDGEPLVLLAESQTTGGYRVPAVVVSADLWQIGQLRPGDTVRFLRVSPEDALVALHQRGDAIGRVTRQPSPTRLFAGFSEWSDEAELAPSQRKGDDDGR